MSSRVFPGLFERQPKPFDGGGVDPGGLAERGHQFPVDAVKDSGFLRVLSAESTNHFNQRRMQRIQLHAFFLFDFQQLRLGVV